jgi:hypothetical protein
VYKRQGKVNDSACSVLRDTGATVCGVRKRLVRSDQYTGETIRCVSFGGRVDKFPLAKVVVSSDFISGEVVCCVLDAPVADFIVGNVPQVSESGASPSPSVHSVAAVTRARSKFLLDSLQVVHFVVSFKTIPALSFSPGGGYVTDGDLSHVGNINI